MTKAKKQRDNNSELAAVIEKFAHTKHRKSAFGVYSNGDRRSEQKAVGKSQQQTMFASVSSALNSK